MTGFSSRCDLENRREWRVGSVCLIMQTLAPGAREAVRRARRLIWGLAASGHHRCRKRVDLAKTKSHRAGHIYSPSVPMLAALTRAPQGTLPPTLGQPRPRPDPTPHPAPKLYLCGPPLLLLPSSLLKSLRWLPSTCKTTGSGSRAVLPGFQSQSCHVAAVGPWTTYITPLPHSLSEHLPSAQRVLRSGATAENKAGPPERQQTSLPIRMGGPCTQGGGGGEGRPSSHLPKGSGRASQADTQGQNKRGRQRAQMCKGSGAGGAYQTS